MFAYKAVITAGSSHEKWAPGTELSAIFFVKADAEEAAFDLACKELSERGYKRVEVRSTKAGVTLESISALSGSAVEAFQDAVADGFGLVVYPEPKA